MPSAIWIRVSARHEGAPRPEPLLPIIGNGRATRRTSLLYPWIPDHVLTRAYLLASSQFPITSAIAALFAQAS
jgi:hypothetical protein